MAIEIDDKTVLVVGSGAMACLFAARLSGAGAKVIMLGSWAEGMQALREHGVRLSGPDGEAQAYPVWVVTRPQEIRGAPFALVLVKSWQTSRAVKQLEDCLAEDGLALTLQNGLGNYEQLVKALGAGRVALGVTTVGATLVEPGLARQSGEGLVSVGAHPQIMPLAGWLRSAGFVIEDAQDANALLWGKLVINAAINPLTAILGVPNGELLNRPSAHALLKAAARETAAVAVSMGMSLPYPDPVAAAESTARRTADNFSSMLQDIRRGAPTEIDAICGAVVRAGEQMGVPTPINRTFWDLVKAIKGE
jgi:2-dehydropantoate 2-reductase